MFKKILLGTVALIAVYLAADYFLGLGFWQLMQDLPRAKAEIAAIESRKGELVSNQEGLKIGAEAPGFTLSSLNGDKVSLESLKGKVVLVEFWASWCITCRRENKSLLDVYASHKDKGFEILAVSLDRDKAPWQKAVEKAGLPWTQVSDLQGTESETATAYGVHSTPTTFLLDKEGKILKKNIRSEELNSLLGEIL